MTNAKIKYSLFLSAIFVVFAMLFFGLDNPGEVQDESIFVLESSVKIDPPDQQIQGGQAPDISTPIEDAKKTPTEVPELEIIEQLLAGLSEEERMALELQVVQTSVSKRVNNLSPGSMSEEERLELFEDIDYLDKNAVFLGNEAEQLKIYVETEVGY